MGGELPARSPCGTWLMLKIEVKRIIKYWHLRAKKRWATGIAHRIKTHSNFYFNLFAFIPGLKPGLIWKIICPHLSMPRRKCRLPEQAEFVCNLSSLGWTGNSWESIISTHSSNNSVCTWKETMLYLPESSAESQGCHTLVISWETLLFSLVGECEVCTCAGDWTPGNFCWCLWAGG